MVLPTCHIWPRTHRSPAVGEGDSRAEGHHGAEEVSGHIAAARRVDRDGQAEVKEDPPACRAQRTFPAGSYLTMKTASCPLFVSVMLPKVAEEL